MDCDFIAVTIDVEWAGETVLMDTIRLLDERQIRATFFCTHEGISVNGHERALHPNFRRNGDAMRKCRQEAAQDWDKWTDRMFYQYVVRATHSLCPEAVGTRSHSLLYDSDLLSVYRDAGLEYDSTYFLPMASHLSPVWKEDILEFPGYYMDHIDLISQSTGFRIDELGLNQRGMKVFDFHPNLVFLNASTEAQYHDSKLHYHDSDRLLELRHSGRGVRTLFIDLLDIIVSKRLPTMTLSEANSAWRSDSKIHGR